MAKAEWGTKRLCPSCGARYYDMKKNPPVCPTCGKVYDPESVQKARRGRAAAEKKLAPEPKPETKVEDIPVADDGNEEDTLIEDAEELADDEEMEEVVVEDE